LAGTILAQLIGFIMLPIYTRYLTPADYGILELLVMTVEVATIIVGVGLPNAIFRFYSEKVSEAEKNAVISSALISGIGLFMIIGGIMFLNAGFFSKLIFGNYAYTHHFRVIFASMALSSSVELPMVYLRARAMSVRFVLISSIKVVLQLSMNILFIVHMGLGILGVLYSTLISSFIFSIYLVASTLRNTKMQFSFRMAWDLFEYGFPLVFSLLGAFILNFADRYFIKAYFALNEVGLYSLGYKFGSMVTGLLLSPFFQHWPSEMFEIDKRDDREQIFVNIFEKLFLFFIVVNFVECVYIKEAIRIISAPEYHSSYKVVPIVCLAYYFAPVISYIQLGILIKKQTKYIAYATIIAAGVNIGLNFLLIPPYGLYGAAVSTVISFFVRFVAVYKWSQMLYPLPYRWLKLNLLLIYCGLMLVVSYFFNPQNLILAIAKDTIFMLAFLATFFVFWLKGHERKLFYELIRNPKEAVRILMK
jgi:O-antigen/teichoic acid export membrane protein